MLTEIDTLPANFFETGARQLKNIFSGPTLIHLHGKLKQPLFVSVLLHGNEETGFLAIQQFLHNYQNAVLPRSLSIFIGNIDAANQHVRKLENQPDYNRIWPGCGECNTPEQKMMQQVVDIMTERKVIASVDIHNTSGHNPHYACINHLEHSFMQLANIFGRTVVYFTRPKGVQTMAFAELCPAVTLECGQIQEHDAANHALSYLKKVIQLPAVPTSSVDEEDIDLFHTKAIVKVPPDIDFRIRQHDHKRDEEQTSLSLHDHIDDYNFREIPAGTVFGKVSSDAINLNLLDVQNEHDEQVFRNYFTVVDNELRTSKSLMPSMLSVSEKAIRQDCLGYLMERIKTDGTLY